MEPDLPVSHYEVAVICWLVVGILHPGNMLRHIRMYPDGNFIVLSRREVRPSEQCCNIPLSHIIPTLSYLVFSLSY